MRQTDPLACDGIPSLLMLLSVASARGIRETGVLPNALWREGGGEGSRAKRAVAPQGGSPASGGPTVRHLLPEGEGKGAHSDF